MKGNRKPTVLIVDDDEHILRMISLALEGSGVHCVTANTGAQGLIRYRTEMPHLVITDLRMPVGDGITLIEAIRKTSRVPVIILSGLVNAHTERMRWLGDVAFLAKPFDRTVLLRHVRERCAKSWQARMHYSSGTIN